MIFATFYLDDDNDDDDHADDADGDDHTDGAKHSPPGDRGPPDCPRPHPPVCGPGPPLTQDISGLSSSNE